MLEEQRHEFPVLLEYGGQLAIQRQALPLQARLQMLAQGVQTSQALAMARPGPEEGGGETGLAHALDLVLSLACAHRQSVCLRG